MHSKHNTHIHVAQNLHKKHTEQRKDILRHLYLQMCVFIPNAFGFDNWLLI